MKRIAATLALALAFGAPSVCQSEPYPTRPIMWVLPFPAGGNVDSNARVVAKSVSEALGQPVIIENKGGAGGLIGTEYVARAKPDGYTIGYGTAGTIATNPALLKNLAFDPLNDLIPVHGLAVSPPVLLVHPSRPYKTLKELVAYAKEHPGAVNYGTSGIGTTVHLAAELLQQVAGIKLTHVPYKGSGAALVDLMAGVLDLSFDYPTTTIPSIEAAKVNALAVFSKERVGALKDVPTTDEAGVVGVELGSWAGVFAPKGTSSEVLEKLESAFHKALRDEAVARYYAEAGQTVSGDMTSSAFKMFIIEDAKRIKSLVEKSDAKTY